MSGPYIPGKHENEPGLLVHGALIEGIGRQKAVDVSGLEIRHHFGRGKNAYLYFRIGIHTAFGKIIAQQQIMHGIVEGNGKDESLHILGGMDVLMIHAQRQSLSVHIFQSRRDERLLGRAQTERHGNGHGGKHLGVVRLPGYRPVAYHGPAGSLVGLSLRKAVFLIKAHGMSHDYGRAAGKRHEAYLHILLFYGAYGIKRHGLGRIQRKNTVYDGHGRGCPQHFHEGTTTDIVSAEYSSNNGGLHRTQHGGFTVSGG